MIYLDKNDKELLHRLYDNTYGSKETGRYASLFWRQENIDSFIPSDVHEYLMKKGLIKIAFVKNKGAYVGITLKGLWRLFLLKKNRL